MIRSSKHILKFQTKTKSFWLDKLFLDYKIDLQFYIDLLWNNQLPTKRNLSSKILPSNLLDHSQYKQLLYKQASEIIRSNKLKKKTSKPIINNVSINIDNRLFNIQKDSVHFNEFIHLRLPYFFDNKKLARFIRLPIKYHKQSLQYSSWNKSNSIKLKKINNNYYVIFTYEKETPKIKDEGNVIGVDQGYKKLLVTSDKQFIGKDFELLYVKISHKRQGSKAFKRALIERDQRINKSIKELKLEEIKEIVIEDLRGIKQGRKVFRKRFRNRYQRWVYRKALNRLQGLSELNGVQLTKVSPVYTSQECSQCGFIRRDNRVGERFCCMNCGYEADADYNASVNILHRGVYNPSTRKEQMELSL